MEHAKSEQVAHLTAEEHAEAERLLKELPIEAVIISINSMEYVSCMKCYLYDRSLQVTTLHSIFDKLDEDHNGFLSSKVLGITACIFSYVPLPVLRLGFLVLQMYSQELRKYINTTLPDSDVKLVTFSSCNFSTYPFVRFFVDRHDELFYWSGLHHDAFFPRFCPHYEPGPVTDCCTCAQLSHSTSFHFCLNVCMSARTLGKSSKSPYRWKYAKDCC